MTNFIKEDPINNAIYGKHGIKRGIEFMFEAGFHMATLILIFSAIDAMGNLVRPKTQEENKSDDFKKWVERYVSLSGDIVVTADDLWGARNAIVHTYGQDSRDVRNGKARLITWALGYNIPAAWAIELDEFSNTIVVNIESIKNAFLKGVDQFLIDIYSGVYDKDLVEQRLDDLLMMYTDPELLKKAR